MKIIPTFFLPLVFAGCIAVSTFDQWAELDAEVVSLYSHGDYDEGLRKGNEALKFAERSFGPKNERIGQSLSHLGLLHMAKGDNVKAEPLLERAFAIHDYELGPWNPKLAITMINLALCYANLNKFEKAEDLYKKAISVFDKSSNTDLALSIALFNLADIYKNKKEVLKAEPLYIRGLSISEKNMGTTPAFLKQVVIVEAFLRSNDRIELADETEKRAVLIRKTLLPKPMFSLEPSAKSSILFSAPLIHGDTLKLNVSMMAKNDILSIQKCGTPCNTAKLIRSVKGTDTINMLDLKIKESGDYYLWVQKILDTGEVGPATVVEFSGDFEKFSARHSTGTIIDGKLIPR